MKHTPRFAVTERRTRIGLYLNQQLRDLETHSQSQHRDRAAALIEAIHECLEQELLDRGFNQPAQLSIEVEAEPAPAAAEPAKQLEPTAPAAIDYSTLIETTEKGVTDEVGTKI
jgi:hypothetical protein